MRMNHRVRVRTDREPRFLDTAGRELLTIRHITEMRNHMPRLHAKEMILGMSIIASPVVAQYDDTPPEWVMPNEIILRPAPLTEGEGVLEQLSEVLVGEIVLLRNDRVLGTKTYRLPPHHIGDTNDLVREILDAGEASGELVYWEQNLVVDNVGGQTGSLWVSGFGVDAQGYARQYAHDMLDLELAHQRSTGQGVLVAVVDTGIDADHEALVSRVSPHGISVLENYPSPHDENSSDPEAINAMRGHGTFVAGLISTIAPDAGLLPVRVLDSEGLGSTDAAAAGIVESVERGAHIITLAFGTPYQSQILNEAIRFANDSGVIVFAAAGNDGELGCYYPASNPLVMNVAACDFQEQFESISNWCDGVDVICPGSMEIVLGVVDDRKSVIGPVPGESGSSEYRAGRGTSFAVGFAAGMAALLRAQHPEWPNAETEVSEIPLVVDELMSDLTHHPIVALPDKAGLRARPSASVLTGFGPIAPGPGDVNGDGCVNSADLGLVLAAFGQPPRSPGLHLVDIDGDFMVGASDLGMLLALWTPCP